MWWPFLSPLPELPRLVVPGADAVLLPDGHPDVDRRDLHRDGRPRALSRPTPIAPRIWGITPMSDQQIGGLIMWIPGGLLFYVVMTFVFFKWAGRDTDTTAGAQVDWRPPRPIGSARRASHDGRSPFARIARPRSDRSPGLAPAGGAPFHDMCTC